MLIEKILNNLKSDSNDFETIVHVTTQFRFFWLQEHIKAIVCGMQNMVIVVTLMNEQRQFQRVPIMEI